MRILAALAVCFSCVVARAQESIFVRDSIPQKWLNDILPEDLPALEHRAWANGLDRAKAEAFSGRYKKSLYTLQDTLNAAPVEVALVKATSLSALGRRDEAIEALSGQQVATDPRVQVMRATILAELGRTKDAIDLLKDHIKQHPGSITGHYRLGQVYEQVGDLESAKSIYGWFMVEPQSFMLRWQRGREKEFDSAEEVTCIARALDRWAALTSAYKDLPQLNDTLLNMFVRAYDVIDRVYWPAHVAAAEYCLSHDDTQKAVEELTAALKGNPSDIQTHSLLAEIALSRFNFDEADRQIAAIREVDRDAIEADLLDARNYLQQRRPADAATRVHRVLERQPDNIEALGLMAATASLQLRDDQAMEILKQVERLDPDNASAYFEVADQLGSMRQYPRSIAMYKIAIERAPWWTAARNGLGLLYTQSGDEDDARITLDAAHALDPYNLATTNYLRLLDELQKFTRKETAHFVVMYDPKLDPIIPEYFSDYLESIHAQVSKAFASEPPVKTYIEVFPTHDAFSVRTTGSPWIGTVGASTGRVIAMVSPRAGENTMGTFNWAQVLKHEYTHTVTLAATENRIPHWMTEGLAVSQEQAPLQWDWIPMLYNAVAKNGLFTMENVTWGFIRPRRPSDRSLAYAQSYWICKYIEETFGQPAILKLLAEFKNGSSEEAAFQKILGKSRSEFQTQFIAWTEQQVATWGYDKKTSEQYDKLREKGEAQVKARQYVDAVKTWEQIVAIRPVDALPHARLAGLYLTGEVNQPEKAIEHLKVLEAVDIKDNRYAKRIARLYRDINQLGDARNYAMKSVYIAPYDLDAHQLLLEIAKKASDQHDIEREERVIPILKQWIEANRPQPLPG